MTERDYPTWICSQCGLEYGRGWRKGHVATFHWGVCGICGKEASVTEPRDFGHLRDGWRDEARAALRGGERAE